MKLTELPKRANGDYEADGGLTLTGFYDTETGEPVIHAGGDGLAGFIVTELAETFDETATDEDQLAEAARAMNHARIDLDNVIAALKRFTS